MATPRQQIKPYNVDASWKKDSIVVPKSRIHPKSRRRTTARDDSQRLEMARDVLDAAGIGDYDAPVCERIRQLLAERDRHQDAICRLIAENAVLRAQETQS